MRTTAIDLSRHQGLLDSDLLSASTILAVGVGGASGVLQDLCRCGVRRFFLIDPDIVSTTNIATQHYSSPHVGRPKVEALTDLLAAINPQVEVASSACRYEYVPPETRREMWTASTIALAMTDQYRTQRVINRDAIEYRVSTIFASVAIGLSQIEVTATFHENIAAGRGCHCCHTWPRVQAYDDGFQNPETINSQPLAASMINAQIGYLTLARIHQQAGSTLPIAQLADLFAQRPCLLTQLQPGFWDPQAFGVVRQNAQLFTCRSFSIDSPRHWTCPDCGTPGVR